MSPKPNLLDTLLLRPVGRFGRQENVPAPIKCPPTFALNQEFYQLHTVEEKPTFVGYNWQRMEPKAVPKCGRFDGRTRSTPKYSTRGMKQLR